MAVSAELPLTERLRLEAVRRLAEDEELEEIERELRRDLHCRGAALSWDTMRRGAGLAVPEAPADATLLPSRGGVAVALVAPLLPRPPAPTAATAAAERAFEAEVSPLLPAVAVAAAAGAAEDDGDDGFGEDDGAAPAAPSAGAAEWCVESQVPWQLGEEPCTLTISQNRAEKLIRFDLLRLESSQTMQVTCTDEYFDELSRAQGHLAGAARINAATRELFRQAMDEQTASAEEAPVALSSAAAEASRGTAEEEEEEEEDDGFGEDDPPGTSGTAAGPAQWCVESQVPWQLGEEACTLTILQNRAEKLIRFDVLKLESAETLHVTCTDDFFDELCRAQPGLAGPARINAATRELFRQALEEQATSKAEAAEAEAARAAALRQQSSGASSFGDADDEEVAAFGNATGRMQVRRKSVTDDFGEDAAEVQTSGRSKVCTTHTAAVPEEERWHVQSQEAFHAAGTSGTLTILSNDCKGLLRFELLQFGSGETLTIGCTSAQFDELCEEQGSLKGPAKVNAATRQMFEEALATLAEGAAVPAAPGP